MKMKKEVWVSISLVETAPAVAMGSLELVDKEERCPRGQAAAQQRILHCQQLQQVRANWSPVQFLIPVVGTRTYQCSAITKRREACPKQLNFLPNTWEFGPFKRV